MDILDKNGRLFGKINIIDLTIILVILFALPVFIFSYEAMTAKKNISSPVIAPAAKWVTVRLRLHVVEPEIEKVIREKDAETDDLGREIGILIKQGDMSYSNGSFKKELVFKLLCTERNGTLYYKNCAVKIGGSITFSTNMYDITGTIMSIDKC